MHFIFIRIKSAYESKKNPYTYNFFTSFIVYVYFILTILNIIETFLIYPILSNLEII